MIWFSLVMLFTVVSITYDYNWWFSFLVICRHFYGIYIHIFIGNLETIKRGIVFSAVPIVNTTRYSFQFIWGKICGTKVFHLTPYDIDGLAKFHKSLGIKTVIFETISWWELMWRVVTVIMHLQGFEFDLNKSSGRLSRSSNKVVISISQ